MDCYIVAIGGGEIKEKETESIDKMMLSLKKEKNKNRNKILFISTASTDSESYIACFTSYFKELGCEVNTLCLVRHDYSEEEIRELIFSSDIIYVGGGDTAYMMDVWKKKKVNLFLKEAYEKGIILSGLSAGAICWAVAGHSDSQSFHQKDWNFCKVEGLGIIPVLLCPHYNEEGRNTFDLMVEETGMPGIALENKTALLMKNNQYRILKEEESNKAYWIKAQNGVIEKTELSEEWFQIENGTLRLINE